MGIKSKTLKDAIHRQRRDEIRMKQAAEELEHFGPNGVAAESSKSTTDVTHWDGKVERTRDKTEG